jgi:DNA repair photolyase
MKRFGEQKPIRFDEKELKEFDRDIKKYGEGQFIFVGSSCDMFACDIPQEWIMKTLDHCSKYDNTYLFQSKNPAGFIEFAVGMPEKVVFCTTIETNRHYEDIMGQSPTPYNRAKAMLELSEFVKTYVTIEPVMDFDMDKMVQLIMACGPAQINIGADSGNNKLPEPSTEKLRQLIIELGMNNGRKVVAKDNLKRLL